MSNTSPRFDLIVYGATGFTGRLVAEYLCQRYGPGGAHAADKVKWAMAGRSAAKLAQVRDDIRAPGDLPLLTADANDPTALLALVRQAKAVITTVGPYQLYGEALLQACVDSGTDYLDLCGEPAWMAQMIARHETAAQKSGARILFSCGFDSVPFDMGVRFLQDAALQRFKAPLQKVRGHVVRMKGGFSGGTAASLVATLEAAGRDPQVNRTMANPFALTPGFKGPAQADNPQAQFEEEAQAWSAPFVMAAINTKNVHRSNLLLRHLYGTDFVYEERQLMGSGTQGELQAKGAARTARLQMLALGFAPTRALIRRFALPKPGEGPGPQERERGRYSLRFAGQTVKGKALSALVNGDRDPGYGSTSKIISECALALVRDTPRTQTGGGIWTPGAALSVETVQRLQQRAGLSFEIETNP